MTEAVSADLSARPVLHLDENLSGAHLGQLTDAVVAQPVLPCHMTRRHEPSSGETPRKDVVVLTGRLAATFSSIKRDVTEASAIVVPAAAEVHAAVEAVLDEEPT